MASGLPTLGKVLHASMNVTQTHPAQQIYIRLCVPHDIQKHSSRPLSPWKVRGRRDTHALEGHLQSWGGPAPGDLLRLAWWKGSAGTTVVLWGPLGSLQDAPQKKGMAPPAGNTSPETAASAKEKEDLAAETHAEGPHQLSLWKLSLGLGVTLRSILTTLPLAPSPSLVVLVASPDV